MYQDQYDREDLERTSDTGAEHVPDGGREASRDLLNASQHVLFYTLYTGTGYADPWGCRRPCLSEGNLSLTSRYLMLSPRLLTTSKKCF